MQNQVLIVDDDTYIRDVLTYSIRRLGHKVYTATNAEEALTFLNDPVHSDIDVVLTDILMPGMSGIELLRTLKQSKPDLPVAMITGIPTVQTSIEALNVGAYAYLVKPFQIDEIRDVVQRGITKSQDLRAQRKSESDLRNRYQRLTEVEHHLSSIQESQFAEGSADNVMLTDLIIGLRHELGNVTTAIKLNLSAIEESSDVPIALRENLEDLQASADDLVSLVSKLTQYPKVDKTTEMVDLRDILAGAIEDAYDHLIKQHTQLDYEVPDDSIGVSCNPAQLQLAIWHLLQNAIEAAGSGSGQVQILVHRQNDCVDVTINDNGSGFKPDQLNTLFSPGYTTKISEGFVRGLGLGLFIARATIEVIGGHISIENRSAGGASVQIELPIVNKTAPNLYS